jgi:hypothetical protein
LGTGYESTCIPHVDSIDLIAERLALYAVKRRQPVTMWFQGEMRMRKLRMIVYECVKLTEHYYLGRCRAIHCRYVPLVSPRLLCPRLGETAHGNSRVELLRNASHSRYSGILPRVSVMSLYVFLISPASSTAFQVASFIDVNALILL